MNIKTYICSCLSAHKDLYRIINEHFVVSGNYRDKIEEELKLHFSQIITTAWLLVEFPYVDKVYRDSFYTYFSSKLIPYKRDSIRISIFKDEITLSDFRDLSVVKLKK